MRQSRGQEQNTRSLLSCSTFLFYPNLNCFCNFQNKLRRASGSKSEMFDGESASARKSYILVHVRRCIQLPESLGHMYDG